MHCSGSKKHRNRVINHHWVFIGRIFFGKSWDIKGWNMIMTDKFVRNPLLIMNDSLFGILLLLVAVNSVHIHAWTFEFCSQLPYNPMSTRGSLEVLQDMKNADLNWWATIVAQHLWHSLICRFETMHHGLWEESYFLQTNTCTSPNWVAPQRQVDDADICRWWWPSSPTFASDGILTSLPDITIIYQLKKKKRNCSQS